MTSSTRRQSSMSSSVKAAAGLSCGRLGRLLYPLEAALDVARTVIALAWAIIIGTSMKITDFSNVSRNSKPFLDTLLALTIDLSMDVIAIRIDAGLWNWKIKLSNTINYDSFIGVRYGNFIGWYFIVLIFSYLIRFGREKYKNNEKDYWKYLSIISIFALLPFYVIFESIQQGKQIFNYAPYFMIVVISLVCFAGYKVLHNYGFNEKSNKIDESSNLIDIELIAFYSFFLFFLISLLFLKLYTSAPLLIVPSIIGIIVHYLFHNLILVKGEMPKRVLKWNYSISK